MNRTLVARHAPWFVPLVFLLASFGRLVAHPSSVLVDAARPTVDRARVVDPSPGNDLTRQYWPMHLYVARALTRTGHLPEWDDRGFGGRPLVGNPQAGLFYPPAWLAWLIPAPSTLGWITLGHLVWAIWGMNRLTRTLGMGVPAQIVTAGCFDLCPYVLAQTFEGHYPHVWAAAWYPWGFDATIQLGRGRWRAGLPLALCLAALALVGHPQEGYYLVIALGCWAIVDLGRMALCPDGRRRFALSLAVWLGVAVLALGLVAVELVPATLAQEWGLRSDRLPLRLASRYHPLPINAVQLGNSFALGGPGDYFGPENYWETVVSVGLIPLILAAVGWTWTLDRHRTVGWKLLVAGAVLFASGRKLGVFALMYEWVPGMDRFRVPSRSLFLANLGIAVLAGFGMEALRRDSPSSSPGCWDWARKRWMVVSIGLTIALGWAWGRGGQPLVPGSYGHAESVASLRRFARSTSELDRLALACNRLATEPIFGCAVVGLSVGLGWAWLRPQHRGRLAVGLGLLALGELAGSGYQLLLVSSPRAFLDPGPVEQAIEQACLPRSGQPASRIRADEAVLTDLAAAELNLGKTDINDSFQVQHAADLYQHLYDLSRTKPIDLTMPMDEPVAERVRQVQQAVFDRLGVSVVALTPHHPRLRALLDENHWPILATVAASGRRADPVTLARNPSALPRAYVVPRAAATVEEGARAVGRLVAIDPRQAVLMAHDPLEGLTNDHRQAYRVAEWVAAEPDRIVLRIAIEHPGLLVVADTWMPGWTATVDGRPVDVDRGNHAQRVVPLVQPGYHEVVLTYRAPGFRLGLAITTASIVVMLGLAAFSRINHGAVT